jgi:hypothetical protein
MSSLLVFIDLRYSHVGISTQLCELLPLYLLSSSPLPNFPVCTVQVLQCVTGGEGIGCVDSIYRSYTLYLTRFRTYKIALSPPNKNLGGEGASDR